MSFTVHVQLSTTADALPIEVSMDETVGDFKRKACLAAGQAMDRETQVLEFNGAATEVDDSAPVEKLGFSAGDTVKLDFRQVKLPKTLERRERILSDIKFEVRKKPNWFNKIFDATIAAKWKAESLPLLADTGEVETPIEFDAEGALDTLFERLCIEAQCILKGTGGRDAEPWFMRVDDGAVDAALAEELDSALEPFRATPDWHPGSEEQVMDLIHPSLYCHVDAGSPPAKKLKLAAGVAVDRSKWDFQWIPADFAVDGDKVRQESYINNLDGDAHPKAQDVVVRVLEKMLPLLRRVKDPSITELPAPSREPSLNALELEEVKDTRKDVYARLQEKCVAEGGDFTDYTGPGFTSYRAMQTQNEHDGLTWEELIHFRLQGEDVDDHFPVAKVFEGAQELGFITPEAAAKAAVTGTVSVTAAPAAAFAAAFDGTLKGSSGVTQANVNEVGERGSTLLYVACRFGHTEVAEWLLNAMRADVSAKNASGGSGSTPLHGAAYGGHDGIVKLLMEKGADASATNDHGDTPLSDAQSPDDSVKAAAKKKCVAALKKKPKKKADSDAEDDEDDGAAAKAKWAKSITSAFIRCVKEGTTLAETKENACKLGDWLFTSQSKDVYWFDSIDLKDEAIARKKEELSKLKAEQVCTLGRRIANKLQVIVKAADIVLAPEKPVYPGGTWHLEGTNAENIVAAGICYYKQENITSSHLEFRDIVDGIEDLDYPQHEHDHIYLRYRVENGDEQLRSLGEVSTPAGRCIGFPNNLQHRAAPFQLRDATKPGVRKMLVFFVVDPDKPTKSSADIPKQQGTMSREDALENRLALMEQRKDVNFGLSCDGVICLCEH